MRSRTTRRVLRMWACPQAQGCTRRQRKGSAPAPQGRKVSSRGQRPRKRYPALTPFPSPRSRGEGRRRQGEGQPSVGFAHSCSLSSPPGGTEGSSPSESR
jgi:hypothetical protein